MRQQEMVRELVDYSVNAALQDASRENLRSIFERGFVGFHNMPKGKLIRELQFRGILDFDFEDSEEDFAIEEESDEELMVMLSEMTTETGAYFD
jgi:hypothetical protein